MASTIKILPRKLGLSLKGAQLLLTPHQIPNAAPCSSSGRSLTLSARLFSKQQPRRPPNQPSISLKKSLRNSKGEPNTNRRNKNDSRSNNTNRQSEPLDVLYQRYKWPLLGAAFTVFGMTMYITLLVSSLTGKGAGPCPHDDHNGKPTGLPADLDPTKTNLEEKDPDEKRQSAEAFDKELDFQEKLTRTCRFRERYIASKARGHVLEVAVGTGRNLPFYDYTDLITADPSTLEARERVHMLRLLDESDALKKLADDPSKKDIGSLEGEILTFTGVDISPDMLTIARTRLREWVPGLSKIMFKKRKEPMPLPGQEAEVLNLLEGKVRLFMGDAERALPPPPSPSAQDNNKKKYDTIVQTFGLCSVSHPTKLLENMADAIQPGTGRILLMEHGMGFYGWLNGWLDRFALPHFQRYGCWWNRDIEGIVREAATEVPGLEVVEVRRPWSHGGTTYLIELMVRSDAVAAAGSGKE
ncbi:S-adenosyl-L-methionine-dependent methyltransferase [Apodospora peruviana]|uniref:S-adenosyl-L-methionine-dependent methyltransferase n=1 Tax=Apodospora peruviana TaxID=516989 RepID=A0AAE0I0M9_9PEZI|nr:S-adenosyl-L-methionine-dependent methyltransferase [Apodospora peruviana]